MKCGPLEHEIRKQAHEDEEEDELLRQIQLPGDTSGVLDHWEIDGLGREFADGEGPEQFLDPITPSVCGLGLNPNSHSLNMPFKDEQCQLQLPCATCCVSEPGVSSEEMVVDDIWGREPDAILDHLLLWGA